MSAEIAAINAATCSGRQGGDEECLTCSSVNIHVRHPKRGRARAVDLTAAAVDALRVWTRVAPSPRRTTPDSVRWGDPVAVLGAIGYTGSLLIAQLALPDPAAQERAAAAVLAAAAVASIVAVALLRRRSRSTHG